MSKEEDWAIRDLIYAGDVESVLAHIRDDPSLTHRRVGGFTCLETATPSRTFRAGRGEEMIRALVAAGCNPNQKNSFMRTTPLLRALDSNNLPAVNCLLELGADPNIGRTVFAAILREDALPFVKALVGHGVDLNRAFEMEGTGITMNALEFAKLHGKDDVVAYLRKQQADESSGGGDLSQALSTPYLDQAAERFGDVSPYHLREIVPTGPDIQIHVATAKNEAGCRTLFTSGLREFAACRVGEQQQEFPIELFVQLDRSWPIGEEALNNPKFNWPYIWMKNIASQLATDGMTIEGPFAVWSAGQQQEQIAPHLPHTALLLMAEIEMDLGSEGSIYLMRLFPLYKEEVALEAAFGINFLINQFDLRDTPFVFTENRENVGA